MASNTSDDTYKYKFVSEPDDDLRCLICLEVAEEPRQHGKCGRLFCKKCLDKHGQDKPCPNCREEQPNYFEDGKSKRNIRALAVKCDNIERKCEWVGTVATLEKHVATCKFTLLPCPKQCKDDNGKVKHFMRKDLGEHLKKYCPNRDHTCKYCGEKGMYANITQVKTLSCCNAKGGCPKTMQRQELDKHVNNECEFAVIPCKYTIFGCNTELKRRDMAAHELDDKLHLHMALDTVVKLEDTVAKLENTVAKLVDVPTAITQLKENSETLKSIKFRLTEFQKKKDNNEIATSPSYYIYPNGYHMAIKVYTHGYGDGKGTHVSVYACILKGNYDAELKWPLLGKVTFTLLNQLEDDNHHCMTSTFTTTDNREVGDNWGRHRFIPHSVLGHDPVKNTQYLKDDTLFQNVI